MSRICGSLAAAGYKVVLVGVRFRNSPVTVEKNFKQKRLFCFARTGKLFYIEYHFRLFLYLLFRRIDLICAIDLDTILPCLFISIIKRIPRVYDAHELFCEMKEIATRPFIYKCWKAVERFAVPRFKLGYTVNKTIADEFSKMYASKYEVIRNMPVLKPLQIPAKAIKYILYQGAVNEGRSFETLIPAMKQVDAQLIICGDGNFMEQAIAIANSHQLQDKVVFKGRLKPEELLDYTRNAWIGVTFFDDVGISNYYSLSNRFFDYLQSGLPQLCVDYPEYRHIIEEFEIAVLIKDLSPDNIAKHLNQLLTDSVLYSRLQDNCIKAREVYNWSTDERKLIEIYKSIC